MAQWINVSIAQWINAFRNNGFVNPVQLPFVCEKTGALTMVKPGLMAGWQAGC